METPLPIASGAGAGAAPELAFCVEEAAGLAHAAVPTLAFALRITSTDPVRSIALTVQIRIAATRRRYDERAQERLVELFGLPKDWARNLHGLLWTTTTVQVPPFTGSTVAPLHVPCTYDLEVAAAKYLNALEDGDVPLEFLFSGTVFYTGGDGRLQVALIGWDKEADFRLPVAAWRETMDRHFPDGAWLRLRRDSFDRLCEYKARRALLTFEDAVDHLLRRAGE